MPEVSIITPIFNGAAFVRNFIVTIQAQSFTDWELIFVDDGSCDETHDILRSSAAQDPRIRAIRCAANGGPSKARNIGMAAAQGRWIAFVDADDFCLPNRLETLMAHAIAKNLDLVADNQYLYDLAAGKIVGVGLAPAGGKAMKLTAKMLFDNDAPPVRFSLGLLKPFVRRAFIEKNSLKFAERFRSNEDFYFLATALIRGAKAEIVMSPLYRYTQQVGGVSRVRSSHSRTAPNWHAMIALSDMIYLENRGLISEELARAIVARRARLERAARIAALQQHLGQRRLGVFAIRLLRDPACWATLMGTLLRPRMTPHQLVI